jgi:hypothetical protein
LKMKTRLRSLSWKRRRRRMAKQRKFPIGLLRLDFHDLWNFNHTAVYSKRDGRMQLRH